MTTADDTLEILKELNEAGVEPGVELERRTQELGGQIVHAGDSEDSDDAMPPMVTTAVEGAGYTTVYHRVTGDPSLVNNNMLPAQLRKRLNEVDYPGRSSERAFTIHDPGVRPPEGTLLCYMHPDHPMRSVCDEFGFIVCRKSNIASPYEQEQHMVHRHGQEWRALERRREQTEADEDRAIQRGMLEAMRGQRPVPETQQEDYLAARSGVLGFEYVCPRKGCGAVITAASAASLSAKKGAHKRRKHPKK